MKVTSRLIHIKDFLAYGNLIEEINTMFNYKHQNKLESGNNFFYLKELTPEEMFRLNRNSWETILCSLGEIDFDEYHLDAYEYMLNNQGDIYEFIDLVTFMHIMLDYGKDFQSISQGNKDKIGSRYKNNTGIYEYSDFSGISIVCTECNEEQAFTTPGLYDKQKLQCPSCKSNLLVEWEIIKRLKLSKADDRCKAIKGERENE